MATPTATGERYHDICADPDACNTCSLWQRPDESRDAWLRRIGDVFRQADFWSLPRVGGAA